MGFVVITSKSIPGSIHPMASNKKYLLPEFFRQLLHVPSAVVLPFQCDAGVGIPQNYLLQGTKRKPNSTMVLILNNMGYLSFKRKCVLHPL